MEARTAGQESQLSRKGQPLPLSQSAEEVIHILKKKLHTLSFVTKEVNSLCHLCHLSFD